MRLPELRVRKLEFPHFAVLLPIQTSRLRFPAIRAH